MESNCKILFLQTDNVKSMTGNSQTFLDSIPEQRKLILGSWKLFCNIFPPRNGLLTYLDCIHMDTIRVVYECSFEQKSECGSTGLQVQACLFFSIAFVRFFVGGSAYQNVGAPYVLDCQSFQNFLKQSCQSCIKVVITGSDAELFFGFFKRLLQRSCHFPFAGFKRECQFVRTMRFWIYD